MAARRRVFYVFLTESWPARAIRSVYYRSTTYIEGVYIDLGCVIGFRYDFVRERGYMHAFSGSPKMLCFRTGAHVSSAGPIFGGLYQRYQS